MEIKKLLSDYFCNVYNIDTSNQYEIEHIKARELIVPGRIDLIPKMKYVEFRDKGFDSKFIKDLYVKHIEAFTLGAYSEDGNRYKNNIDQYLSTFENLITSIKNEGFNEEISVIPVGKYNEIMDGAHRVAIAAYYDLSVPIIRFNNLVANNNTEFFKKRFLEEDYLDYIVTEYCKYKSDTYIIVLWPRAKGYENEVESIIKDTCEVVYKKDKIKLSYNGLRNFIVQAYATHHWVGNIEERFKGATPQIQGCYDKDGMIVTYVLQCDSLEDILRVKDKIRDLYKIGNYSVHSTDNQVETITLANLLLNNNSIEFMNNGNPDYYVDFSKKLNSYKENIINQNLNEEDFIVDSSSILALYGLRNPEDIDFISLSDNYHLIENSFIENHNKYIRYYERTIVDLVMNPQSYFYYNEMKFTSLNVLKKFKKNRNEDKDKLDLKLIETINTKKNSFVRYKLKYRLFIKRHKHFLLFHSKKQTILALKKLHLYNLSRKIYRGLKKVL